MWPGRCKKKQVMDHTTEFLMLKFLTVFLIPFLTLRSYVTSHRNRTLELQWTTETGEEGKAVPWRSSAHGWFSPQDEIACKIMPRHEVSWGFMSFKIFWTMPEVLHSPCTSHGWLWFLTSRHDLCQFPCTEGGGVSLDSGAMVPETLHWLVCLLLTTLYGPCR